jgi:hypothetical protein
MMHRRQALHAFLRDYYHQKALIGPGTNWCDWMAGPLPDSSGPHY